MRTVRLYNYLRTMIIMMSLLSPKIIADYTDRDIGCFPDHDPPLILQGNSGAPPLQPQHSHQRLDIHQ